MKKDVRIILHNIRSAHNVGAILRTADGAGVTQVYLSGYTPLPIDRFGKKNSDIAKTALGAEQSVRWMQRKSLPRLVSLLQNEKVSVVGVEQSSVSTPISKYKQPLKVAYVLGNEVEGLTSKELSLCNMVVELPMLGKKESLNVSAVAAIVLYRPLV
jgi:tRNA G18 (ribose-2'-O)-methylase SpoU